MIYTSCGKCGHNIIMVHITIGCNSQNPCYGGIGIAANAKENLRNSEEGVYQLLTYHIGKLTYVP